MTGYLNQNEIDALMNGKKENNLLQAAEDKINDPNTGKETVKTPVVEKVEFALLKSWGRGPDTTRPDLHFFGSIPLFVSCELGTAQVTVRELLKFEEGSIIKLDKMAGESSTLLVNERYLGQAEVVIINDRFGIRVTAVGLNEVKGIIDTIETTKRETTLQYPRAGENTEGGSQEENK